MTKTFLVVYAKATGSNFAGQAPDVPGCVSAGDTLEEMRAMMREGLESHFQVMSEYGMALPEPTATSVEFKDEDFEGVEYFVVEHLEVKMPVQIQKGVTISA
jgi:predicted RNase H-like HicB family nuclease